MNHLLEALLAVPNPSEAFDLSLERLLHCRPHDSDQVQLIASAMRAGKALIEASKRSSRRRATVHNSTSWPLPADLTIKVFSMLDTWSLCHVAATCSMFNNCTMDPLCYAVIDLTSAVPKADNAVVSTMIKRAGKNFQSLKLGTRPSPSSEVDLSQPIFRINGNSSNAPGPSYNRKRPRQWREIFVDSVLTRSCLMALSADDGAAGALLRRLHLYNIDKMDNSALSTALSACQWLLELEVIGLHINLNTTLESVSKHCHMMEHLLFESSETGREDGLAFSCICTGLVNGCPHLRSLALRGVRLHDPELCILVKGLPNLKYIDFSTSNLVTGSFLRDLSNRMNVTALEVLILRDCVHLKEAEVSLFLSALLAGDCKSLRFLDISNKGGLSAEEDWINICISISRLLEERPDLTLLAKYPQQASFTEVERNSECEISSNSSLQMTPNSAIGSYSTDSSDSSYISDQGSADEDIPDVSFVGGDSFDECEF